MKTIGSLGLLLIIGLAQPAEGFGQDLDQKLALVKKVYKLSPKECAPTLRSSDNRRAAGKILFNSTALSGDRDVSCATCHLERFGTADGLPLAIGVGGAGEGKVRYLGGGTLVQRNALSLTGRGRPEFKTLFWDGKVQRQGGTTVTQFGSEVFGKFNSPLSAAAILPLIERDEFIGVTRLWRENSIQEAAEGKYYYDRYVEVSHALRKRFLQGKKEEDRRIASVLRAAGKKLEQLELADLGNLLAEFIDNRFICKESVWDRYLAGDTKVLTHQQKVGAMLFYGKGRCVSCHSGPYFSDFRFYSIGTPQGGFGPHSRHRDIGRAAVTNRFEDLYKFRTPPLIDIAKTAPYGHNGSLPSLRDAIEMHFNPLIRYMRDPELYQTERFNVGKVLSMRAPVLGTIDISKDTELDALVAFVEML